jgi:hypothetical protein
MGTIPILHSIQTRFKKDGEVPLDTTVSTGQIWN